MSQGHKRSRSKITGILGIYHYLFDNDSELHTLPELCSPVPFWSEGRGGIFYCPFTCRVSAKTVQIMRVQRLCRGGWVGGGLSVRHNSTRNVSLPMSNRRTVPHVRTSWDRFSGLPLVDSVSLTDRHPRPDFLLLFYPIIVIFLHRLCGSDAPSF